MNNDAILDVTAFIDTAQWLSSIFGAPLSVEQVAHGAAAPGQEAINWMGEQLNAQAASKLICNILAQGKPEDAAKDLQRNYTTLFEGIFRHNSVLPYESAWRQQPKVAPAAEMDAILRALDLHVSDDVHEPSDHLAIELATLVAALSSGRHNIAVDLVNRLQEWAPDFSAALTQKNPTGFYAAAGELLLALIREVTDTLAGIKPAASYQSERHEGVFV